MCYAFVGVIEHDFCFAHHLPAIISKKLGRQVCVRTDDVAALAEIAITSLVSGLQISIRYYRIVCLRASTVTREESGDIFVVASV